MSTVRNAARKLRAWQRGEPIQRYDTIHHALVSAEQTLIVAFVRMAGESRPWGIAWGAAGSEPTVRSVPDGRVRDDVSALVAEFAEDLLEHLRVHNWTFDPASEKPELDELRQVWFPNGQHIAMLHQLNYTYSQTKWGGDNQDILRALGRLAGWMFRDTSRTGHQHVVDASRLLSDAYVFPAQDVRTAHLGYQLAWLTTAGTREDRLSAASAAEQLTVSPTIDPSRDRDELEDLVSAWQGARHDGDQDAPASAIAAILEEELSRRWQLAEQAFDHLSDSGMPVNEGTSQLVAQAHQEFWYQHQRIELRLSDPSQGPSFVPHAETDHHGSAAASRYLHHAAADEAYIGSLIHDDLALFREALAEGRAVESEVAEVYDVGEGRSTDPHWVIRLDPTTPHRLRENAYLIPYGSPGHKVTVLDLDATEDDLLVTLQWTGRKTRALTQPVIAKPLDDAWLGQKVQFIQADASSITRLRSSRVWKAKDGPGAWLTHAKGTRPKEVADDEREADRVYDDVAQIEEGVDL